MGNESYYNYYKVLEKTDEEKNEYSDLTVDQWEKDRENGEFWLYVGNTHESAGIKMTFEEFEKVKEAVEKLKAHQWD